jgi:hypothetical protein
LSEIVAAIVKDVLMPSVNKVGDELLKSIPQESGKYQMFPSFCE